MRQLNFSYFILLTFIFLLFLSACIGSQKDKAPHFEIEHIDQSTIPLPERSINPIATKTPSSLPLSPKTSQSISEAPESVKIPFSKSSSPKSRTSLITTTLTPTNDLFAEKIEEEHREKRGRERSEEVNEEIDRETDGETNTTEANKKRNAEEEKGSSSSSRNTIHFQTSVKADGERSFPFLATPNSLILVNTEAEDGLELSIEVEDMRTQQKVEILSKMEDQDTTAYEIPDGMGPLYRVLIKSVGESEGNYSGLFIGSGGVAFSLLPIYGVTAHLAEKRTLAYLYTGKAESTVQFNLLPHPQDNLDLAVKIYKLNDLKTILLEEKPNGVDKKVEFLFTPPEKESRTYLIMVEEVSGKGGKFKMTIEKDNLSDLEDALMSRIQTATTIPI